MIMFINHKIMELDINRKYTRITFYGDINK